MAKNPPAKNRPSENTDGARYEYRVWGKHRDARKMLGKLADDESTELVEDCYLLVDDPSWNAKIRDNTLKIKQLIAERKGFEQWSSDRHRSADTAPTPFDDVFEQLRLHRPQQGKKYDLPTEVLGLDPDGGVRAVFVTKERHRYRIGGLRAESTDIEIHETGESLHTLSIEGDDLDELRALRRRLGLRDSANVAVHRALDAEID